MPQTKLEVKFVKTMNFTKNKVESFHYISDKTTYRDKTTNKDSSACYSHAINKHGTTKQIRQYLMKCLKALDKYERSSNVRSNT